MAVDILYNDSVIRHLYMNTKTTLECGGKKMLGDISVKFSTKGVFKYLDVANKVDANKVVIIPCRGKIMPDNITIYAPCIFYQVFAGCGTSSFMTADNETFLVRED